MGCAQSSQGQQGRNGRGEDAAAATGGGPPAPPDKTGSLAAPVQGISSDGDPATAPKKQVRDSVHDINGGAGKATKDGRGGSCKSCTSISDECDAGRSSDAPTQLPGATPTSPTGAATDAKTAAAAMDGGGAAGSSLDEGCIGGLNVALLSTGGSTAGGGGHRNSSIDAAKHASSNRSSFAAEAIPTAGGGRQQQQLAGLMAARGSRGGPESGAAAAGGGGGGGAGGQSPLPAGLEAARSSAQARMSSIQAADVMGVGGDKAATVPRGLPSAQDPLPGFHPPAALAAAYAPLGALPLDTPVPLEVLQRLWRAASGEEALGTARALASLGVLRLASLEDGSCWALPAPTHVAHAAAVATAAAAAADGGGEGGAGAGAAPSALGGVAAVHSRLVAAYTRGGAVPLEGLRDDGYIIQALSHHLVGCGQLDALRRLLMNPGWLEAKLHAYGVGAVVRDFRRYLQEADSDDDAADVKLLLQAFQLSLGAAMEHPSARMMREQMLARLMAVAASGRLKDWYADQTAKCAAEAMLAANSRLLHLMPRSPSLAQAGGVQRMTLRGHSGPIPRVAIAPNCCEVVTISEDGSAQVWDMNIGDCVLQLTRHSALTAVGISPDSGAVVVGCADGTAAVWSLATGQVTHTLRGHSDKINSLAIDKQGIRVVTGSDDHTGRVWNMASGECEAVLRGHGGASGLVGAVLDVCVCSDGTLAVSVSDDFSGRVWDLDEDGEELHVLEGHGGWVTSAAFVGTSHRVVTASHDATARIWDALRGRCLFVLSGHTGRLNRVTVDPGGSWAITSSDDQTARVWDCETGEMKLLLQGHSAHVTDAAITRDGRKAVTVSGDGSGALWDMATGTREAVLEGHTGEVAAVVLTQRGRFAVTAGREDCTARVWDLAAAGERGLAPPPPTHMGGRVSALQALPDGQLVVSAGDDGRLLLWDPIEGVCLKQLEGHRAGIRFMRVSADGERLLTGSGDRQISAWNWAEYSAAASVVGARRSLERRELMLATMTTANGSAGGHSALVATGGTTTAAGGGGGGVGVGGGGGGGGRAASSTTADAGTGGTADGAGRALATMSPMFSTEGTTVVGGGGGVDGDGGGGGSSRSSEEDPMAALAALKPPAASGSAPRVVPSSSATVPLAAVAAPAAPPTVAQSLLSAADRPGSVVGSVPGGGNLRGVKSLLEVFSTLRADPLRASMPAQQGSRVKHMAFDGACGTAAVLLYDSTVAVYDVATGRAVAQLIRRGERDATRTHSGGVNAVYLTRDGATAVTISKDCTARAWDVATATTRFVVEGHTDGLVTADISGDEALLATAAYDKTVRVTRLATGAPVAVLDHPQPPAVVAFSPNSRWMAVGLEDHSVVVWDLVNRCCLPSLDAHKAALAALIWSPDSRFLLSAGGDCTARLWRSEDGRQQAFFMGDAAITAACFAGNPVSDIVVVGDAAGAVHFLDFAEELQGWSA